MVTRIERLVCRVILSNKTCLLKNLKSILVVDKTAFSILFSSSLDVVIIFSACLSTFLLYLLSHLRPTIYCCSESSQKDPPLAFSPCAIPTSRTGRSTPSSQTCWMRSLLTDHTSSDSAPYPGPPPKLGTGLCPYLQYLRDKLKTKQKEGLEELKNKK